MLNHTGSCGVLSLSICASWKPVTTLHGTDDRDARRRTPPPCAANQRIRAAFLLAHRRCSRGSASSPQAGIPPRCGLAFYQVGQGMIGAVHRAVEVDSHVVFKKIQCWSNPQPGDAVSPAFVDEQVHPPKAATAFSTIALHCTSSLRPQLSFRPKAAGRMPPEVESVTPTPNPSLRRHVAGTCPWKNTKDLRRWPLEAAPRCDPSPWGGE